MFMELFLKDIESDLRYKKYDKKPLIMKNHHFQAKGLKKSSLKSI